MNVLVLATTDRELIFLRGGPDPEDRPSQGRRGWLSSLSRKASIGQWRMSRRVGPWYRWIREKLAALVSPEEAVTRGGLVARRVRFLHPTTVTEEQIRPAWQAFVDRRLRHHLLWMAIDLAISPFLLLLALLPGPNLLGYWFVFRAGCHGVAVFGGRRIRGASVPWTFEPDPAFDVPLDPPAVERVRSLARRENRRRFPEALRAVLAGLEVPASCGGLQEAPRSG